MFLIISTSENRKCLALPEQKKKKNTIALYKTYKIKAPPWPTSLEFYKSESTPRLPPALRKFARFAIIKLRVKKQQYELHE